MGLHHHSLASIEVKIFIRWERFKRSSTTWNSQIQILKAWKFQGLPASHLYEPKEAISPRPKLTKVSTSKLSDFGEGRDGMATTQSVRLCTKWTIKKFSQNNIKSKIPVLSWFNLRESLHEKEKQVVKKNWKMNLFKNKQFSEVLFQIMQPPYSFLKSLVIFPIPLAVLQQLAFLH